MLKPSQFDENRTNTPIHTLPELVRIASCVDEILPTENFEFSVASLAKRFKTLALLHAYDGEDFKNLCILRLLSNTQLDSDIFASILNLPIPSDAQIRKLLSNYWIYFPLTKIIDELNATIWEKDPLNIPRDI